MSKRDKCVLNWKQAFSKYWRTAMRRTRKGSWERATPLSIKLIKRRCCKTPAAKTIIVKVFPYKRSLVSFKWCARFVRQFDLETNLGCFSGEGGDGLVNWLASLKRKLLRLIWMWLASNIFRLWQEMLMDNCSSEILFHGVMSWLICAAAAGRPGAMDFSTRTRSIS